MMNFSRIFRVCVARSLLVISFAFVPFSLFAATPLDINTATAAEFSAVMSGVGAKKAEAIIAYREANGRFESIEQLSQVKGIGDVLLSRNKGLLQVSTDEESSVN
ncbi:helix-hairpin-helix domain-containing protein [Marinomonas sp. M1K-6]|uniref:Helix-hairpin-helix domain-containing protein n=1 Tax=Marinomonas profundi TaxID=2726122 RepID=A0A847R8Z8_9GAMM|nr:helix-hairpin-helix domain-containing protein [Marinomonas profundi]NLQ16730.1 helix-hairpin-helix domain-containing protein [Marinomonas profundi]UDV03695.1 helix-hairpin-helix domain-containing protein [Marinomonas profundi]